jgi:hypothetical protein
MLALRNANDLVARVRESLAPLKAALDERDNWELLASQHEAGEIAKMAIPKQAAHGAGGSSRGGRSKGGRNRPINRSDLSVVFTPATTVPKQVPRAGSNIYWRVESTRLSQISASTSGIVENNYSFSLTNLTDYSSLATVFDQFHIAQASIRFMSTTPLSSTGNLGDFHTAIDLDNTTNLGSTAAIDEYASAQVVILSPNRPYHTRSCRPCVKTTTATVASASIERLWLDCAVASAVPHFGIRSILAQVGTAGLLIQPELSLWVAFRSSI